jgi:4'-phosphopantetheinyl transferase
MNTAESFPFISCEEILPEIHLCSVDIVAVVRTYFPGREMPSAAISGPCFDRFLFDSGTSLPENFGEFRVFKRQIEHLGGRAAFAFLDRKFLGGGHELAKLESGEPVVSGADIPISISHAGNYACACVSLRAGRVGVDIERIRPFGDRPSFFRIAFPEEDSSDLMALSDREIMRRWTLKEAFLKVIGKGFAEHLGSIRVTNDAILYSGNNIALEMNTVEREGHVLSVIYSDRKTFAGMGLQK